MRIATRPVFLGSCLALLAAVACGGGGAAGPAAPSEMGGATIAGTVNDGNASAASIRPLGTTAASAPSGMTVTVVGTNLTTSIDVDGRFQIANVPAGNVQLLFKATSLNATVQVSGVGQDELIQIEVSVSGGTAAIVNEVRSSGKVSLCHRTESGAYNLISVGASAEPAHRAHGDAAVGEPVPGDPTKVFDSQCRPSQAGVTIEKSTNGEDADAAPGPTIPVGSSVTWTYVVTNTGTVDLTNVVVSDDKNVAVNCGGQTTLAAGQSMTCTGSGLATEGQYENIGTVTADSPAGPLTDSDPSHYLGEAPDTDEEEAKVQLCHRTGNGTYHLIEVGISAEPAHRAHGDGTIGEAVPGQAGKFFGANCSVS